MMRPVTRSLRVHHRHRPSSCLVSGNRHQYRQMHLALSTLVLILVLSAALSRRKAPRWTHQGRVDLGPAFWTPAGGTSSRDSDSRQIIISPPFFNSIEWPTPKQKAHVMLFVLCLEKFIHEYPSESEPVPSPRIR